MRVDPNSPWTDERLAHAAKLWATGWSAALIAKDMLKTFQLKVSRNAVVGVLHRRGLAGREAASHLTERPPAKPQLTTPGRIRVAGNGATFTDAPARKPRVVIPFRDEPTGTRTVMDIGLCECRWPIGDPASVEFTFCGRHARAAKPYCAEHSALAFQPQTTKRPPRAVDARRFA